MSGRVFLDTNVLVYAYSNDDPVKRVKALEVCLLDDAWISTQVLIEFINTFRRKFGSAWTDLEASLEELTQNYPLHVNTATTVSEALRLANRYQLSWFDSLIVAAALECGCETLFSEDLNEGLVVDGKLTVVNPFRQ